MDFISDYERGLENFHREPTTTPGRLMIGHRPSGGVVTLGQGGFCTAIDEPISVLYRHEQGFTGHTDRLPNRHLRRLSNRILGSTFRASEQIHARYIRPIRQGRQPASRSTPTTRVTAGSSSSTPASSDAKASSRSDSARRIAPAGRITGSRLRIRRPRRCPLPWPQACASAWGFFHAVRSSRLTLIPDRDRRLDRRVLRSRWDEAAVIVPPSPAVSFPGPKRAATPRAWGSVAPPRDPHHTAR